MFFFIAAGNVVCFDKQMNSKKKKIFLFKLYPEPPENLFDILEKYVQNNAVLFTVDIPVSEEKMRCGTIENVFATTDFGLERADDMDAVWKLLRKIQPNGPLVNSEFYPGWLTHWQEKNQRRDADLVANTLK